MQILKSILIPFFVLILSSNLSAQTYIGKEKDIQQILKNIANFSQFYMNGEHQKLADCYTTDGKIFPNNRDIMEGTKTLDQYWTVPEDVKVLHHKVTPSEIRIVKKTAYDYGYYEGKTQAPDGTVSSWGGKYVIVWKKVGKEWKIYLDIWNNRAKK